MGLICDRVWYSFTQYPDKTAVKTVEKSYSYGEIKAIADNYCSFINRITGENKRIIGLYMSRSVDFIALAISIMKIGSAFLVLDMELPDSRLKNIIEISGIDLIVSDVASEGLKDIFGISVIQISDIINKDSGINADIVFIKSKPEDIAYVLFTSGSTGHPKGVKIPQRALAAFCDGFSEAVKLKKYESILALTNTAFDISILELICPLALGMTIILATDSEKKHPRRTIQLIEKLRPEVIQMTPSYLTYLQLYNKDMKWVDGVKMVILGGEKVTYNCLDFFSGHQNIEVFDAYGPTEATIWFSVGRLNHGSGINVGRPIGQMKYLIVDEEMKECECGELLLSGDCLALGYLNNDTATSEKFILLDSVLYYRSGDLAKKDSVGNLIILGRCDNQIKRFGHRIELEDIEETIIKLTQINSCVSVCRGDVLYCYYQDTVEKPDVTRLYKILNNELPSYMIPQVFLGLAQLPLTLNGKVDRVMLNKNTHIEIMKNEILSMITNQINRKIVLEASLTDNGFNSFEFITMIVSIENKFEIEFDDDAIMMNTYKDINIFLDYVIALIGQSKENIVTL